MKRLCLIAIIAIAMTGFIFSAGAYTLSGSISGAVFLGGLTLVNAVSMDGGMPPAYYTGIVLLGNGAYSINDVPDGNYIIIAYQDRDGNLLPSLGDYLGWYGTPLPQVLNVTGNMSGLNITVAELPNQTIEGEITYSGTQSGLIIIEGATDPQFTQGNIYSVVLDTVAGGGSYMLFADPGTYYVRAFMDTDTNFQPSGSDPIGYYGQPGQPQPVTSPGTNVNFELFDGQPNPLTLTLTPIGGAPTIPAGGGAFRYSVNIVNNGSSSENIDAWIDVVLPNGHPFGPVINRSFTIPAGANVTRTLSQNVPGNAPAGTYCYRAFAGDYPNTIAAADSFNFMKSSNFDAGTSCGDWNLYGWDKTETFVVSPDGFVLHPAAPNPFNPTTEIAFTLYTAGAVEIGLYDVRGNLVSELARGMYPAGTHNLTVDGSELSSGVYFARMLSGGDVRTVKLMLLK